MRVPYDDTGKKNNRTKTIYTIRLFSVYNHTVGISQITTSVGNNNDDTGPADYDVRKSVKLVLKDVIRTN